MVTILEAIPDIFTITLLPILIILIYKNSGVLLFKVVSLGDNRTIALPVFCLSIPSSFYFIRIFLHVIFLEYQKPYVELARSVGTTNIKLLNFHIIRNILDELFINSKTIIWTMLSSLFVIEYLFNILGITYLITRYQSPEMFMIGQGFCFCRFSLSINAMTYLSRESLRGNLLDTLVA
ncbi:ABC transporter permease subunit [Bacillus sp. CECT 9360]|uniref:ABC transporter permease subunit n=1 Tax=Bacillus sp. CECT 9360 TaxID=2845821 RepID=UPI00339DC614